MGFSAAQIVYDGATPGTGKDPSLSYTSGDQAVLQFSAGEFNSITLDFDVVAGTAPTSIEFLLEGSSDKYRVAYASSRWKNLGAQVVGAGSVAQQETVRSITWSLAASSASGHQWQEPINTQKFRVRCKRTGGDGTTRLVVYATMGVSK